MWLRSQTLGLTSCSLCACILYVMRSAVHLNQPCIQPPNPTQPNYFSQPLARLHRALCRGDAHAMSYGWVVAV